MDTRTGPLEATVAHLSWEMTQKSESSRELQREWVRHQTELVELTNQDSQLRIRIQQRTAEQTVIAICVMFGKGA